MEFQDLFFQYAEKNPEGIFSFLNLTVTEDIANQIHLSKLQDKDLYKIRQLSLQLAQFIIDDDGHLILDKVDYVLQKADRSKAILQEDNTNDTFLVENILRVLKYLTSHKTLIKKFKKISLPLCHKKAEGFIKDTLLLKKEEVVTDAHLKRAILCTLLTPLRQTVGSCFATACAIYLQQQDIYQMFLDLEDLLKMGTLTRLINGVSYFVPFNPTMGMGELKKHLTPSSFAFLPYSPSLLYAFENASLYMTHELEKHLSSVFSFFTSNLTAIEKKEKIAELMVQVLEKKQVDNLYQLLDEILLEYFDLKEEDFLAKKRLEKTEHFIASSYHPSMIQTTSSKKDKVEEYFEVKKILFSSFQSFVTCPLLKSWEYTLASFCDVKKEFTLWNLYSSLGLSSKEEGGIGAFLFKEIDQKLKAANDNVISYYEEAVILEGKIRGNEAVLYRTEIQSEEMRLRSEMAVDAQRLQLILEKKEEAEAITKSYQELFNHLVSSYIDLFETFFREVYDPDMIEQSAVDYNDSPAGFRLMATHGRKDSSTWTSIQDQDEFIQALRDFFIATENRIVSSFPIVEVHRDISSLITEMIQYIQSPIFIEHALKRVQMTHQAFLGQVNKAFKDKIVQKPWGYISGGTLDTLAKTYFKKDSLEKKERIIESPTELFIYLIDLLQVIEQPFKDKILDKNLSFLMYNGAHAFLFCPYFPSFAAAWKNTASSIVILYELLINKAEEFVTKISLSKEMQKDLIQEFLKNSNQKEEIMVSYISRENLSIIEFTQHFLSQFSVKPVVFSSFLYRALLIPQSLSDIYEVFDALPFDTDDRRAQARSHFQGRPLNLLSLQREIKKCLIKSYDSVCMPYDYHREILSVLEKQKKIYPRPILFADTNWPCYYFGFLPNPITQELELWRFDTIASRGQLMEKEISGFGSTWGVILDQLIYEK